MSTLILTFDWFAGAGDNRVHAVSTACVPGEDGYLRTVCGRTSAFNGSPAGKPCPSCTGQLDPAPTAAR